VVDSKVREGTIGPMMRYEGETGRNYTEWMVTQPRDERIFGGCRPGEGDKGEPSRAGLHYGTDLKTLSLRVEIFIHVQRDRAFVKKEWTGGNKRSGYGGKWGKGRVSIRDDRDRCN